jgi:hypothetical protein
MQAAGAMRNELSQTLTAAYAEGLISEHTFAVRVEHVLRDQVINPERLVGDLCFRAPEGGLRDRLSQTMSTVIGRVGTLLGGGGERPFALLGLDWAGEARELVVGRSSRCDIVLWDATISRRHARLIFRDGRWVLQDLGSTNGTTLNGRRVGRCELRPGDDLALGQAWLRVD